MTQPLHIFDLDDDALRQIVTDWGEPAYRAKQILEWVYAKRAGTFDAMANLPKALRETLNERMKITSSTIVRHQQATDGVGLISPIRARWRNKGYAAVALQGHERDDVRRLGIP